MSSTVLATEPPYRMLNVIDGTSEWLEERRNSIGASDVPNVMNLPGSYGSPLEVYRSKLGVDSEFPDELNFWGHAMEDVVTQWVARYYSELGEISPGFMARSTINPRVHASFDRFIDGVPLQIKTVSAFQAPKWADGPPLIVQAQEQTEMFVAGTSKAYVAAAFDARHGELFTVYRDDEFISKMLDAVDEMWARIETRNPPAPITVGEGVTLWVDHQKAVTVHPPAAEAVLDANRRYMELVDEGAAIERERDKIKLDMTNLMGAADADTIVVGRQPIFTWKTTKTGKRTFRRCPIDERNLRY